MNVIRTLILILLAALPLAADDAALFIERIEVRNNKRVSADVVIAESRLREGRTYSESELRDAASRLSRLPFLLSADFALEKGSERGRLVLVITVNETKPFFYNLEARPFLDRDTRFIEPDDSGSANFANEGALGFRWFVGRRGAIHLGVASTGTRHEFVRDYTTFELGYTQYDLFGTRAFATFNLRKPVDGLTAGLLSPQLVVGVPLSANQTVTLQMDEVTFDDGTRNVGGVEFERRSSQRTLSARWSYNTTNDPILPTRGTVLQVEPLMQWSDASSIRPLETGGYVPDAFHSRTFSLGASAARYWELSERDSISADVRGEWARNLQRVYYDGVEIDNSAHYGSIGAGFSHSLWSAEQRANGDSRLELNLRYANRSRPDVVYGTYEPPGRDVRQISTSWLRRSSWGTLRLGVGYAW